MNENVFLVDPVTVKYAETAVNKSDGSVQSYQADKIGRASCRERV